MDIAVIILAIILFMTACFLMKSVFYLICINLKDTDRKRKRMRNRFMFLLAVLSVGLLALSLWTTKPVINISLNSSTKENAPDTIIFNGNEYELVPIKNEEE